MDFKYKWDGRRPNPSLDAKGLQWGPEGLATAQPTSIKTAATEGEAGGGECERVTPFRTRNLAYRQYLKTGDWLPFGRLSLYSLICKHKMGGWPKATTKEKGR